MPSLRGARGEDGVVPLPGEGQLPAGRLLLRRPLPPLALQLNVRDAPGGRRENHMPGDAEGRSGEQAPARKSVFRP